MKELYQKYKEIINYVIFELITTLISLTVYYILSLTILEPNVSKGVTNRAFVFNSKNENKFKEFITFIGARLSTLLPDMAITFLFVY